MVNYKHLYFITILDLLCCAQGSPVVAPEVSSISVSPVQVIDVIFEVAKVVDGVRKKLTDPPVTIIEVIDRRPPTVVKESTKVRFRRSSYENLSELEAGRWSDREVNGQQLVTDLMRLLEGFGVDRSMKNRSDCVRTYENRILEATKEVRSDVQKCFSRTHEEGTMYTKNVDVEKIEGKQEENRGDDNKKTLGRRCGHRGSAEDGKNCGLGNFDKSHTEENSTANPVTPTLGEISSESEGIETATRNIKDNFNPSTARVENNMTITGGDVELKMNRGGGEDVSIPTGSGESDLTGSGAIAQSSEIGRQEPVAIDDVRVVLRRGLTNTKTPLVALVCAVKVTRIARQKIEQLIQESDRCFKSEDGNGTRRPYINS